MMYLPSYKIDRSINQRIKFHLNKDTVMTILKKYKKYYVKMYNKQKKKNHKIHKKVEKKIKKKYTKNATFGVIHLGNSHIIDKMKKNINFLILFFLGQIILKKKTCFFLYFHGNMPYIVVHFFLS